MELDWTTSAYLNPNSWFALLGALLAFAIPVILIVPPVSLRPSDALLQTHSKAGIRRNRSALKNGPTSTSPSRAPRVQGLVVYPIKSCRGIELTESRVLPEGLEFDRLFTFAQLKSPFPVAVDANGNEKNQHSWEFITQRQFARLALVKVDLWLPDKKKLKHQGLAHTQEAFLTVRFPWKELGWRGVLETVAAKLRTGLRAEAEREVLLPIDFPSEKEIEEKKYTYEPVTIWKQPVTALNLEKELPEALRLYLGVSNKLGLFRIDPAHFRGLPSDAPTQEKAMYRPVAKFQDAFPLNLVNLASIDDFDAKVPKDEELKTVDLWRFRPNIIVSGAPAYTEETWKKIRFIRGTSKFHQELLVSVSCRTTRCKLPNVDPVTGFRHRVEPDKSLRAHRNVDEGAPLKGCMGMQMVPLFDDIFNTSAPGTVTNADLYGWIGTGMDLIVDETGDHKLL